MTDEEKAIEIGNKHSESIKPSDKQFYSFFRECKDAALEMAEWKDEQYKKMFEVPDYCKSFEEITNYIGHDVFATGYNRARDFCIESFKEYLKSKKSQNGFNKLNTVCDTNTIDMIIDELIENFEI